MLRLKSLLLMPVLLSALCSALLACGTKGPLYIPEQRYPQATEKSAVDSNKADSEKAAPSQTQPTTKE